MMTTSLALLTLEPCGRLTAATARSSATFTERQAATDWDDLLSRDLTVVRPAVDRLVGTAGQAVPWLPALG